MSRELAQQFLTRNLELVFPYVKMGKIDSLDLFGPSELMILELYDHNRSRWKKALDIGANLGLHSIMMSRYGWEVMAFEPDHEHFQNLRWNLGRNVCPLVKARMAAVHTEDGHMGFVRVLDNLTGNHLVGYKDSYGPRQEVLVQTVDCRPLFDWADFAKIDCEGNEADILLTTTQEQMKHLSCVVEVRNEANARVLFEHFGGLGVPIWSQKIGWEGARSVDDMPHMNREGSIFIGLQPPFP